MALITAKTFEGFGNNPDALFKLKIYRGEGMLLLAMNWKSGRPAKNFVGFAIEYRSPGAKEFVALKNRIPFDKKDKENEASLSSLKAPFQKFRWVHFPRNVDLKGNFTYKVQPVFMNEQDELSYGEAQQASIELNNFGPKNLSVAFTRGFVSSQAFVDRYEPDGGIRALLPAKAREGLKFTPTHPKAKTALFWMGFRARYAILRLLDDAIKDKKAQVRVVAYDLNEPEVVNRLEQLGTRLQIIIDNSAEHGEKTSAEAEAAKRLTKSTGGNVKRHHMGQLQHNKTIVVDGPKVKAAICGSTNFTWRGLYVQANNAATVYGAKAIKPFKEAFDHYWQFDTVKGFGATSSAVWNDLGITGMEAKVAFSPHASNNELLGEVATDIENDTKSNLFYSLAFLFQTSGAIRNAITKLTLDSKYFVYGISDRKVGGIDIQKPDGNVEPVYPSELAKNLPEPFKSEPTGGMGTRMHHKFVVIDFDKPTARVYFGSYNFSPTADKKNGENLLLVKDRRIAVSYMIEALRIFDHYHFRIAVKEAKKLKKELLLSKPPRVAGEQAWWEPYYTDKRKIRDRELFS